MAIGLTDKAICKLIEFSIYVMELKFLELLVEHPYYLYIWSKLYISNSPFFIHLINHQERITKVVHSFNFEI